MIVLDALDTNQDTAFTDKPAWPIVGWDSCHIVYKFAGYGSVPGSIGGDPDYGYPSEYLQDGRYATEFGVNFTAADYVTVDFEDWTKDETVCPHTNEMIPPYDALANIHQTSLDVRPQTSGKYAFYNHGPANGVVDAGNECFEPVISQDQDNINLSAYINWSGYPGGSPAALTTLLRRIQNRGRESEKYITIPAFFNTSFMYIDSDASVVLPIADWRQVLQWVFHWHSGLMLWYHNDTQEGGAYVTSWFDAAVQANVAAIQEEYDKLWANMIVGSIA